MVKKYTVRLAGIHDADLINLARNYDIGVKNLYKDCLISYVQKNEFIYDLPMPIGNEEALNKLKFSLDFDDTNPDEAKVTKLLDSIKGRYKNTFIKNTVRLYIKMPVATLFVEDPEVAKLVEYYNEDSRRKEGLYPAKKRERKKIISSSDISSVKSTEPKNNKNKSVTEKKDIPKITEKIKVIIPEEKVNSVHREKSPEPKDDSNILSMFDSLF